MDFALVIIRKAFRCKRQRKWRIDSRGECNYDGSDTSQGRYFDSSCHFHSIHRDINPCAAHADSCNGRWHLHT